MVGRAWIRPSFLFPLTLGLVGLGAGPPVHAADIAKDERAVTVWLMFNLPAVFLEANETTLVRAEKLRQDYSKLKNVDVLNLTPDRFVRTVERNPVYGAGLVASLDGQLELIRCLDAFAKANGVRVRVYFLDWQTALEELTRVQPADPHYPQVVQLGGTWYAEFEDAGKLADLASRGAAHYRPRKQFVVPSPGEHAVPWFLDFHVLFYWRTDLHGRVLPANTLPPEIESWDHLAEVIRQTAAKVGPPSVASQSALRPRKPLTSPMVFPVWQNYNVLHRWFDLAKAGGGGLVRKGLLCRNRCSLAEPESLRVPLLVTDLARDGCVGLAYVPDAVARECFASGEFGMLIEQPAFAVDFERGVNGDAGTTRASFWTHTAGVSALPATLLSGSVLCAFRQPGPAEAPDEAIRLLDFLATDAEVLAILSGNGIPPAETDGFDGWIAKAAPTPHMEKALRAAVARGASYPPLTDWASTVETPHTMYMTEWLWRAAASGDRQQVLQQARRAADDLDSRIDWWSQTLNTLLSLPVLILGIAVLMSAVFGLTILVYWLAKLYRHQKRLRTFTSSALSLGACDHRSPPRDFEHCENDGPTIKEKRIRIAAAIAGWQDAGNPEFWESRALLRVVEDTLLDVLEHRGVLPDAHLQFKAAGHTLPAFLTGKLDLVVDVAPATHVKYPFMMGQLLYCLLDNAIKCLLDEPQKDQANPPKLEIRLSEIPLRLEVRNCGCVPDKIGKLVNASGDVDEFLKEARALVAHESCDRRPGIGTILAYLIAKDCYRGLTLNNVGDNVVASVSL